MRSLIGERFVRWSSSAHATASPARANAATKLSPSPCSTGRTPSCSATSFEAAWFMRAVAGVIAARLVSFVCELRGGRGDDRLLFWRWAGDLSSQKALDELHASVDVMIADRCRKPTADLLSHLIQLEVDGEDLTIDDIHRLVAALGAGADTD